MSEKINSKWSKTTRFPYKIDYNDHFETPLIAYQDILPLLDLISSPTPRSSHVLYDPYYCNGLSKKLLQQLGFVKVIHECRDFYQDVKDENLPKFQTLVTNPPYSQEHKIKCLEFAVQQFKSHGKPFFLLMPNYVASKEYYKRIIKEVQDGIAYVIPSTPYEYSHPDGTGHEVPPFESMWYCGIGPDSTQQAKEKLGPARLATSIQELLQRKIISSAKRPNPKQRKKRQRRQRQQTGDSSIGETKPKATVTKTVRKKSLYRDAISGVRKKRRF